MRASVRVRACAGQQFLTLEFKGLIPASLWPLASGFVGGAPHPHLLGDRLPLVFFSLQLGSWGGEQGFREAGSPRLFLAPLPPDTSLGMPTHGLGEVRT